MIFTNKSKNNKGIALVTIMITITMLSVIATALLYISANNFAMKASNSLGKNNFYETDAKLVETTTAIRNIAMNSGDPNENIKNNLCVVEADGTTIDETHYDINKVAALVSTTGYTFHTSSGEIKKENHPTEANVTRYTFKDIEIKHTSTGGFENSVKTDLVVDVFEKVVPGSGGGGGVGNMSMLLDSPLSSTSATFKNLTMTGNAYMADYIAPSEWVDGVSYVGAGTGGLVMSNESRLNLVGDNNVVYGDVVLSGGASLVVYGDLTVFGDVSVSEQATLILADGAKLYQMKTEKVPGKDHVSTFTAGIGNVYPTNLSANIQDVSIENFKKFADAVNIYDIDSTKFSNKEYGLITKIFKKGPVDMSDSKPFGENRIIDLNPDGSNGAIEIYNFSGSGYTVSNRDRERGLYMNSPVYGFDQFGFGFIGNYDSELSNLNAYNYNNRLMISFNTKKITFLQSCVNTTWISLAPVTADLQHCVTLSKVGTTQFNYMTAGKGDTESEAYDVDSNPFNHVKFTLNKFSPSATFEGKFGSFFESDCNTTVDNMFGYASGGGGSAGSTIYKSAIQFKDYSRDFE